MIGTVVALRENFTDIKVSRLCFKVKLAMEVIYKKVIIVLCLCLIDFQT